MKKIPLNANKPTSRTHDKSEPRRKAYSYIRFSSRKQIDGDSERRQTTETIEACQRHNWELDAHLKFFDAGLSGYKGHNRKRGKLKAFLDAVDAGLVPKGSVLIIEHLDRLTREPLQTAVDTVFAILSRGIDIHTTKDNDIYTRADLDNLPRRIKLECLLSLSWEESDKKSRRQKSLWQRKSTTANEIKTTRWCPSWLRPNDTAIPCEFSGRRAPTSGFTVDEAKAQIVRYIFSLADQGHGVQAIQRRLNKEQIPSISAKSKVGNWGSLYVWRLLRSPSVVGDYTIMGQTYRSYYPEIVKREVFDRVQVQLNTRKFAHGPLGKDVSNLFQGLLWSLQDRCRIRVIKRGRSRCEKRIVSIKAYYAVKGCRFITYPYDPIEDAFIRLVTELRAADLVADTPVVSEQEALRNRLFLIEQQLEQITSHIVAGKSIHVLVKAAERLEQEKRETQTKLQQSAVLGSPSLESTKTIAEQLTAATDEEQAELRLRLQAAIRRLVKEILVHIHYEEWQSASHKPWSKTPKERMTKATGCLLAINFHGGGFRTIVLGEVPATVREKWGIRYSETLAVRKMSC